MNEAENGKKFDWVAAHRRMAAFEAALALGSDSGPDETAGMLRQRARALAAPPPEAIDVDTFEAVVFAFGANRFGVRIEQVEAVIPTDGLISVPCTPTTIRGAINHRGQILAVVDLGAYLDVPLLTAPSDGARIVIIATAGRKLGLLAEPPLGVEAVEAARVVPITNMLTDDEGRSHANLTASLILLIDAEYLTGDPKVTVNYDGD